MPSIQKTPLVEFSKMLENISKDKFVSMKDGTSDAKPVDVSAKLMLETFFKDGRYNHIDIMCAREYNYQDTAVRSLRSVSADSAAVSTKQKRLPRFRFFIFKGPHQYEWIMEKYKRDSFAPIPDGLDFKNFIIKFYETVFFSESEELRKMEQDPDIWHIVLVGYRANELGETSPTQWRIISACSFKLHDIDGGFIYLMWLAVSEEKASLSRWCPGQHSKKDQENSNKLGNFFDGKEFSNGKGIGTTMVALMQKVAQMTVDDNNRSKLSYQRIICQSNDESYLFYMRGVGFLGCSYSNSAPEDLKLQLIVSYQLHFFELRGIVTYNRHPSIQTTPFLFHDLLNRSICISYNYSSESTPHHLQACLPPSMTKCPESCFQLNASNTAKGSQRFFVKNLKTNVKLPDDMKDFDVPFSLKELKVPVNTRTATKLLEICCKVEETFPVKLIVIEREIFGLVLIRLLVFDYLQSILSDKNSALAMSSAGGGIDFFLPPEDLKGDDTTFVQFLDNSRNELFHQERQFFTSMLWYISKMDTGVPKNHYNNPKLYEKNLPKKSSSRSSLLWKDQTKSQLWKDFAKNVLRRPLSDFESNLLVNDEVMSLLSELPTSPTMTRGSSNTPKRVQEMLANFSKVFPIVESFVNCYDTSQDVFLSLVGVFFKVRITKIFFTKKEDGEFQLYKTVLHEGTGDSDLVRDIVVLVSNSVSVFKGLEYGLFLQNCDVKVADYVERMASSYKEFRTSYLQGLELEVDSDKPQRKQTHAKDRHEEEDTDVQMKEYGINTLADSSNRPDNMTISKTDQQKEIVFQSIEWCCAGKFCCVPSAACRPRLHVCLICDLSMHAICGKMQTGDDEDKAICFLCADSNLRPGIIPVTNQEDNLSKSSSKPNSTEPNPTDPVGKSHQDKENVSTLLDQEHDSADILANMSQDNRPALLPIAPSLAAMPENFPDQDQRFGNDDDDVGFSKKQKKSNNKRRSNVFEDDEDPDPVHKPSAKEMPVKYFHSVEWCSACEYCRNSLMACGSNAIQCQICNLPMHQFCGIHYKNGDTTCFSCLDEGRRPEIIPLPSPVQETVQDVTRQTTAYPRKPSTIPKAPKPRNRLPLANASKKKGSTGNSISKKDKRQPSTSLTGESSKKGRSSDNVFDQCLKLVRQVPGQTKDEEPHYIERTYKFSQQLSGRARNQFDYQEELDSLMSLADANNIITDNSEFLDVPLHFRIESLPEARSNRYATSDDGDFTDHETNMFLIREQILADNADVQGRLEDLISTKTKQVSELSKNSRSKRKEAAKEKQDLLQEIQYYQQELSHHKHCMANEELLRHPDSIVMLRSTSYKEGYRFEGLSAKVFEDNTKRIAIPLTKNWVESFFHESFVKDVVALAANKGYIHMKNRDDNVTEAGRQIAETFAEKLQNSVIRKAYENTFVIVKLRVIMEFVGVDEQPSKKTWQIKSISKDDLFSNNYFLSERLIEQKTDYVTFRIVRSTKKPKRGEKGYDVNEKVDVLRKQLSDWLEIDEELLKNKECVGQKVPKSLEAMVLEDRRLDLQFKRSKNISIANFEKFEMESKPHYFVNKDEDFNWYDDLYEIPQYNAGEKQIAAFRYDAVRKFFYGRTIKAVQGGRRRYIEEVLPYEWVDQNLPRDFQQVLIAHASSTAYLFVPVGNSSGREFPYEYDTSKPMIKYQQNERNTCSTSSFASLLHYLGYECQAAWVEEFGRAFVGNPLNDQHRIMQSMFFNFQNIKNSRFFSRWIVTKIDVDSFDIWKEDARKTLRLLHALGSDGSANHAFCVHDGMLFDSNLKYAVELNEENLEFCCGAFYEGIIAGYELFPKENKKALKRRKMRNKLKNAVRHESKVNHD